MKLDYLQFLFFFPQKLCMARALNNSFFHVQNGHK